ncbi:HALOACID DEHALOGENASE-LIKE HYDROLASE (HAD) SUPERFAMILY PROTEIN [Salix purpurea]|uniref:Mitochondrial import inner membrane translocase subunit TIM50 n=1 Tax=Salix purpurea TaxID=77065 RepID=A0A9Q0TTN0_SALPP|nr:HALOACID DEHALOGENASE-LIKE HYDROLASE (HAD) SUPERFAMILY PROTEIN [Salix purpurea]
MAEGKRTDSSLKIIPVIYDDDSEEDRGDLPDDLSLDKLSLKVPKKKLLILCLGGLLCHRVCLKRGSGYVRTNRRPDASYGSFKVYKRPFCDDFVKFCFERFEVGIWSSAKEWYMNDALDGVMRGFRSKLLFAWDQDKCTDSGLKTLENRKKPIFLKQFKTLSALSWCKELDTCQNTLLIDNDPYKALLNPPHTAIFPDEYTVDCAGDSALGPEGDLRVYLEGLADAEDVPSYVKDHPFGKPAITPLHPDWGFYSKIVRRLSKESIEN